MRHWHRRLDMLKDKEGQDDGQSEYLNHTNERIYHSSMRPIRFEGGVSFLLPWSFDGIIFPLRVQYCTPRARCQVLFPYMMF